MKKVYLEFLRLLSIVLVIFNWRLKQVLFQYPDLDILEVEKFSQIESANSGEAYICYESNDEAVSFIMDNNMDYQQFGHYYLAIGK